MIKVNNDAKWGRKSNQDVRKEVVKEIASRYGLMVTRQQVLEYKQSTNRPITDVSFIFKLRRYKTGIRATYTLQSLVVQDPTDSSVSDNMESPAQENSLVSP